MDTRLSLKQLLDLTNPKPLRNDLTQLNTMVSGWKTKHNILQCLSYPEQYVESTQAITNFVHRLLGYCSVNGVVDHVQISDIIRERYGVKFFYSNNKAHSGMYVLDIGNVFLLIDFNEQHKALKENILYSVNRSIREEIFVKSVDNLHFLGKYALPLIQDWLDFCAETGLDLKSIYTYVSTLLGCYVSKEKESDVYRFNFLPSSKYFLLQVE
jgi:hypothetical protein